MKTKRFNIRLDEALYEKIKEKADALGLSMSSFVRLLIIRYVNEEAQRADR